MQDFSFSQVFLGMLLMTVVASGVAAESCPDRSSASPAQLKDTDYQKRLVAGLSKSWSSAESVRLVRFGSYVDSNGKMGGVCCISATYDMGGAARASLRRKLRKLKFSPAKHDGKFLPVFVGFSLLTQKTDAGVESTLLMNQQISIDDYGIQYVAPQRINTSQRDFLGLTHALTLSAEIGVQISSKGIASDARVIRWMDGQEESKAKFVAKMNEQCFIPGFHNGLPAAMTYHELFQTPNTCYVNPSRRAN